LLGNWHGGFGPGAAGKGPDHRHLASGLPVLHLTTSTVDRSAWVPATFAPALSGMSRTRDGSAYEQSETELGRVEGDELAVALGPSPDERSSRSLFNARCFIYGTTLRRESPPGALRRLEAVPVPFPGWRGQSAWSRCRGRSGLRSCRRSVVRWRSRGSSAEPDAISREGLETQIAVGLLTAGQLTSLR
jgi:hypothetical protein